MKAAILAGGFGTRLRPLTANTPKPMAPVMNTPMLEHIINLLKKHGFTDITMMLFFQPEAITGYFKDGAAFGVKISYVTSDRDLGTAGCVKLAEKIFDGEDFLVISGDVFTNFDITKALEFHRKKAAAATMLLTKSPDPLRYGIVITEKNGRVKKLLEKPSWGEVFSDTINTGIYVFSPKIFGYIPADTNFDFAKDLFPLVLSKKEELFGFVAEGYWKDIGTLAEYRQVHEDILKGEISCDIRGERKGSIGKDIWAGKNVKIAAGAVLKDSVVIGDNTIIEEGAHISGSVIGNNCYIDGNARIVNSILWDNNVIEKEADIKEAVIGSRNKIRYKAYIGVGAVISDNCFVGKEAIVKPEVKMWPNKTVDDFSIVSSSLVWAERWSNRLFDIYGITAIANTELTPEVGARIGAAYASALPRGAYILISRDYHRSSLMIERSIMSGIMSSGINIYDFRIMPLPVTKLVAATLNVAGGLHIRKSPYDGKMIDIKFFDSAGTDISLSQEKSIESSFFREEYRRAENDAVGIIAYPPRAFEYYLESFKSHINSEAIRKRKFKIVLDYSHGAALNILPAILGELECEVMALNAFMDEKRLTRDHDKFTEAMDKLSSGVKTLKADVGVMIDSGGQKIFIVDDKGREFRDDEAVLLMLKLFFANNKGKTAAVPVTVTRMAEAMAGRAAGKVIRSGTSYRAMLTAAKDKKADFVAEEKGGFIFSDFNASFDGMMSLVKLLEYMAGYGKPLSKAAADMPVFIKTAENEPVPWEKRGSVMKELFVLSGSSKRAIEGVGFHEAGADVLIIPDNDRPFFRVYAEGKERRRVSAAAAKYRRLVKKLAGRAGAGE
ncbi:MAG TPA: nucleotidyltransferase [bacterium]|nr:nucleotidyltransferase [bacterium]